LLEEERGLERALRPCLAGAFLAGGEELFVVEEHLLLEQLENEGALCGIFGTALGAVGDHEVCGSSAGDGPFLAGRGGRSAVDVEHGRGDRARLRVGAALTLRVAERARSGARRIRIGIRATFIRYQGCMARMWRDARCWRCSESSGSAGVPRRLMRRRPAAPPWCGRVK
jgi:hypothetical protein